MYKKEKEDVETIGLEDLYEDILDYIDNDPSCNKIKLNDHIDMIKRISAKVDLSEKIIKLISEEFFNEVKNAVINGKSYCIEEFGILSLEPSSKSVFIKFVPSGYFKNKFRKKHGL